MWLMVYIEPTPYVLGLVDAVRKGYREGVFVAFLARDVSQDWLLPETELDAEFLPSGPAAKRRRIHALIASGRYDGVHLAGWGNKWLLYALWCARRHGLPVVMESDSQLRKRRGWREALKALAYPVLFAQVRRFLPAGSRQAAYLRRYGVARDRMRVAGMTVDTAAISRWCDAQPARRRSDVVRFGFVGRLVREKGLDDLLAAFSVHLAGIDHLRLALAGDGPMAGELQHALAADSRIEWAGRLSGEALWKFYRSLDVFVLPSRFEPWGLVVNESMAFGLPVIATDRVGCIDDLVRAQTTGVIVPGADPSRLAAAMRHMAEDQARRERLGESARRHIQPWTLAAEANAVIDTWRACLA